MMNRVKKQKTKKYAQQKHAMDRIGEKDRYGLDISEEEYYRLCGYIRKGKTIYADGTTLRFIKKQSSRVTIWNIIWKGDKSLIAVYDKDRKRIATFLPQEWLDRRSKNEPASDPLP